MATGYQVIHIEKRVAISYGLNRHITRVQFITEGEDRIVAVWIPDNADPSKTKDNVELVSREYTDEDGQTITMTLQQAVDKRLREAGIKPRKGQATCLEIIFSGSHDVMASMSKKELRKWAKEILEWAQKIWGKENVVSAILHVDETTPHIHMIVVPIVTGQSRRTMNYQLNDEKQRKSTKHYKIDHNKLRLCANEVYTSGKLYEYHDRCAKEVNQKYGLERGIKAEPGSKKKHTDSIEHNRMLAVQAAEQQALIDELMSDYDDKKTEIQADIQQLEVSRNTLSTAVEEEEEKRNEAERKTKEAEDKAKEQQALIEELTSDYAEKKAKLEADIQQLQENREALSTAVEEEEERRKEAERKTKETEEKTKKAEEILSSLEEKITHNIGVIDQQNADFSARKEELAQIKTEIETNIQTITQQKQTISDNEATIQKQEKQKASTVINDDAADRAILKKYSTVSALADEEARLKRSIVLKKHDLKMATDNLEKRRRQLSIQVDLDSIPKKGIMGGYRPEDVDKFIRSVENAKILEAINKVPDEINVEGELQKELVRLHAVEDDFKEFQNSPERLQQRIMHLKTEAKRRSITEILKYALQKDVEVIRFTVETTPKGEDIFARFTIKGDTTQYAAHISPEERISYTDENLNSLQECKDNSRENIWWVLGSLSEIQAKREKEDTMSRYTTKLSTLFQERIKVIDYIQEGNHYLLFAANRRAYEVKSDGSTRSTGDKRVKTLADCRKYAQEKIWTNHGDINNPTINTIKMKR